MFLTFCGGAKVVTGANYLIEVGTKKILVDCGLFQGQPELTELNRLDFPYNPSQIDYVFITHSHLDHCGRLPKLVKDGFRGQIICSKPTKDLMAVSLADGAHIMAMEAKEKNQPPLFTEEDLWQMLNLTKAYDYQEKIKLEPGIEFCFQDAGHILGSSLIELFLKGKNRSKKLVFTGDLGNSPNPLLNPPAIIKQADYVIIESAYGDRLHETRKQGQQIIIDVLTKTLQRKGVVLIPSFAIERTQELLYQLNDLVENNKIPDIPIFMDSPLAIKITEVYKKYQHYLNLKAKGIIKSGDDIFNFPGLHITPSKEESKHIFKVRPPKIIIAGSGMSTGGRILFHEKEYLSNPNNCFLVIGYQVNGTLGRKIIDGEPIVEILGDQVKNHAEVQAIGAFSAHADQKQLLNFISQFKSPPKNIFVVQGENKPAQALKKMIEAKLQYPAHVPSFEEKIEL